MKTYTPAVRTFNVMLKNIQLQLIKIRLINLNAIDILNAVKHLQSSEDEITYPTSWFNNDFWPDTLTFQHLANSDSQINVGLPITIFFLV